MIYKNNTIDYVSEKFLKEINKKIPNLVYTTTSLHDQYIRIMFDNEFKDCNYNDIILFEPNDVSRFPVSYLGKSMKKIAVSAIKYNCKLYKQQCVYYVEFKVNENENLF